MDRNPKAMRTGMAADCFVEQSFERTESSAISSSQSRRLLQAGVAFLLFISFEGFAIPYLAAPRLGLSTHTLGALQGVLLLVLGLLWPRLTLGTTARRIAFWLLLYSAVSILAAYVMGGLIGA